MTEGTIFTKPWTIALTGEFNLPTGEVRRALVIPENGGGNVRLKKKGRVRWTNRTDQSVRLNFTDWPDEDGGTPDPIWPFSSYTGGQTVEPLAGSVTIAANQNFEGQVAGTGRILVKYTVYMLTAGKVDPIVLPLDPMIVVER